MTFLNYYNTIGRKEDFKRKITGESLTDQSQYVSASIREMAKRFGIEAIMAKAEQLSATESLKDNLYGNDFTQMFKSKDALLNTKKKLREQFEKIPARLRKTLFSDNVEEFVNAYTYNDTNKLKELNKVGIVSDTQLEQAIAYNKELETTRLENQTRNNFIKELEKKKEGLYAQFKETGTINIDINKSPTISNQNLQNSNQQQS